MLGKYYEENMILHQIAYCVTLTHLHTFIFYFENVDE